MNKIMDISDSSSPSFDKISLVFNVDMTLDIEPEHIVKMLSIMESDSMAKIINKLGRAFNKDQSTECWAAEDLDKEGIEFIENMAYFIRNKE